MNSSTQNQGVMEDRIVLFQYPLNFCILFWEQSVKNPDKHTEVIGTRRQFLTALLAMSGHSSMKQRWEESHLST